VFDAVGSIAVGLLLGVVAIVLIDRNRRFLLGESTSPELENAVLVELLARDQVESVSYLHLEFVGPSRVYMVAAVDLVGNDTEEHVAGRLRAVEASLEESQYVEEAVLTLSVPGAPVLRPTGEEIPEVVKDGTVEDVAAGGAGTLRA
jgi:Co/Zn/Cd efflux system component